MIKVPLRRYGGKVYLAQWIISHFPKHTTYIEPFCGSASVFFAKEPAQAEILNDIDDRIIQAFETLRSRPFELAAALWATPYAQKNWRREIPDGLERAALMIASSQQFYAGATNTSTFSVDSGHANKNKARVWADWFQRVLPAAARLKDAQILSMDALQVIGRFSDLEDACWFIDPPYVGHEDEYRHSVDFGALALALAGVKGKVILSGTEKEREFFPTWRSVGREYVGRAGVGGAGHKKQKSKTYTEYLYLNWNEGGPPTT